MSGHDTAPGANWQPIATAPRDGTPVLLFHPAWETLQIGISVECGGRAVWQQPNGDLLWQATHWTRLPSPPLLRSRPLTAG